jgi:hypothetical protein
MIGAAVATRKRRGGQPQKYFWTPERDQALRDRYDPRTRGAIAALAAAIGWPTWVLKKRAALLGITRPVDRKEWTAEEVAFLWTHTGTRSAEWMRKKLGRSLTSVVLKLKRMKISRRVKDGYTLRELELCFGVDHRVIERWVEEGKLCSLRRGAPGQNAAPGIRRRGTDRERDPWAVSDSDILRFITAHPMEFRLERVDQFWFMDLITSGGLLGKAFADERKLESA